RGGGDCNGGGKAFAGETWILPRGQAEHGFHTPRFGFDTPGSAGNHRPSSRGAAGRNESVFRDSGSDAGSGMGGAPLGKDAAGCGKAVFDDSLYVPFTRNGGVKGDENRDRRTGGQERGGGAGPKTRTRSEERRQGKEWREKGPS